MLDPESARAASAAGAVVFLDADFETCYERICGDTNRPIAVSSTKEELLERFNARREIYLKHSDIRIDCGGSPIETAESIVDAVKKLR